MKTLFSFITLFIISINSFAESSLIGQYKFLHPIVMQKADISGTPILNEFETSETDQIFNVIRELNNNMVLIRIADYTRKLNKTEKADPALAGRLFVPTSNFYKYNFESNAATFDGLQVNEKNARDYKVDQIYFIISKTTLNQHAYYQQGVSLAVGVINFPFKWRIQGNGQGDFSGSFNFGTALGATISKKSYRKWSFSIITGYSISSVRLDSSTVSNNRSLLSTSNDFTALSISFGPLVQYNNIQAGLFFGWDHLTRLNQSTYDWDYQGKPWMSIGIGYTIFSGEGKNESKNKLEQD